jgi:hypothetical protein
LEIDAIKNKVDNVNQLLDDLVTGEIVKASTGEFRRYLTFAIARRFSSWYPTYFETQGGCYAFITRDPKEIENNAGVIVIDPGIRFGEVLREKFNISLHDIRAVLVSHYHPDHVTGLFEILTLTHESHFPCKYYLNEASYEAFKSFQGKYNKILELNRDQVVELANYSYNPGQDASRSGGGVSEKIYAKALPTFHGEIGERHKSLGFFFHISSGTAHYHLTLLGDTDGNPRYHDTYMRYIKDSDVVVLHLGAFTKKGYAEGNRHLYETGLINILNCINCVKGSKIPHEESKLLQCISERKVEKDGHQVKAGPDHDSCQYRKENYFKDLKLVIISELGLDVAPMSYLVKSTEILRWASRMYPLLLFFKFFKNDDDDDYLLKIKGREPSGSLGDKIGKHKTLFSTIAFRAIDDLVTTTLEYPQLVELYYGSLFATLSVLYLIVPTLSQVFWKDKLPEELVKRYSNLSEHEKEKKLRTEKLRILIQEIQKNTELKNFLAKNRELSGLVTATYTRDEVIEQLYRNLTHLLDEMLISVYDVSPTDALKKLQSFSELIFKNAKEIYEPAFKSEENQEVMYSKSRDVIAFLNSISFFDYETLRMIRQLLDSSIDLRQLVLLFSLGLADYVDNTTKMTKALKDIEATHLARQTEEKSIGEDLLGMLAEYSEGSVKYLLSDIGMEVNFSSDGHLQVREDGGNWIPVDRVSQRCEHGRLRLD